MVIANYKVITRQFNYNRNNQQLSFTVPAKEIKKAMNSTSKKATAKLIEPVLVVMYFNKKAPPVDNSPSEEEEFADEEGIDFSVDSYRSV